MVLLEKCLDVLDSFIIDYAEIFLGLGVLMRLLEVES